MKMIVMQLLKSMLPDKILYKFLYFYREKKYQKSLRKAFKYDFERYIKFSYTSGTPILHEPHLLSLIIKDYHSLEKGLTMPDFRPGFGELKIKHLVENCILYSKKYQTDNIQYKHALGVLKEYKERHDEINYGLKPEIINLINSIDYLNIYSFDGKQIQTSKKEYFKYSQSQFDVFSNSRKSIRDFSGEKINNDNFEDALNLSINTPSACNRQAWRTYVFHNKEKVAEILDIQQGAYGFGHLTDKLIVITSELGMFGDVKERSQAYIDGGIYAMNLLYCLHFHQIGACILNCSNTPEKDELLINSCKSNRSEVFIAMIACGIPKEKFSIAYSRRYTLPFFNKEL